MQKIGLLFGSFNPIHHGHLLLATYIKEAANLDEIWFIVSPQNPFKINAVLIDEHHRLKMVQLAIEKNEHFKVNDIEFQLDKPSYTYITIQKLQAQFSNCHFSLIIGEDNLEQLHKWKEIDWIINNVEVLVYNRTTVNNSTKISNQQIKQYTLPLMDISATEIRQRIKEKKSIQYFVPEAVEQYIKFHNLYL